MEVGCSPVSNPDFRKTKEQGPEQRWRVIRDCRPGSLRVMQVHSIVSWEPTGAALGQVLAAGQYIIDF